MGAVFLWRACVTATSLQEVCFIDSEFHNSLSPSFSFVYLFFSLYDFFQVFATLPHACDWSALDLLQAFTPCPLLCCTVTCYLCWRLLPLSSIPHQWGFCMLEQCLAELRFLRTGSTYADWLQHLGYKSESLTISPLSSPEEFKCKRIDPNEWFCDLGSHFIRIWFLESNQSFLHC